MLILLLALLGLGLAACGIRDAGPDDAQLPILWWVGGTVGIFLLSGALWLLDSVFRRHGRRDDRRDRRDERGPGD